MKTLQDVIKQGPATTIDRVRKTQVVTTFSKAKEIALPDAVLNLGAHFNDGKWFVTIGYVFGSLHGCGEELRENVFEMFGFYN